MKSYSRKTRFASITTCAIIVSVISGCATTPTIPILMINFGKVHQSQEVHLWGKTYLEKETEAIAKQEVQSMLEQAKGIKPATAGDIMPKGIR